MAKWNPFRRKRPAPPRVAASRGLRGAGSQASVSAEEVEGFLRGGQPLFVSSSNVVVVTYHPDDGKMLVEYKKGKRYLYSDVSEAEAASFVRAPSKGSWVWDHLRIRGTKDGHRKPYVRL